jgi:hypothetical protein
VSQSRAGGSRNGKSKADAIREYLAKNPSAKTKDVVVALEEKGIKVSAAHVYLVNTKGKQKRRRARRIAATASAKRTGILNPVEAVVRVRQLANDLGGVQHLKQLVDILAM